MSSDTETKGLRYVGKGNVVTSSHTQDRYRDFKQESDNSLDQTPIFQKNSDLVIGGKDDQNDNSILMSFENAQNLNDATPQQDASQKDEKSAARLPTLHLHSPLEEADEKLDDKLREN